jgi:tripartite-type tricarboxylate transporter receptor subunit TctC
MNGRIPIAALLLLACGGAAAQATSSSSGQAYPAKPVRIVVGFTPGGGNDVISRLAATKLTASMGRQFVVENRPGAAGSIGAEIVAKSPPDGYTLFLAGVASHAINPSMQKNLPYDPVRDFDPICLMATAPVLMAVHPSLPAGTVKQFITFAKARPGQINYASNGIGSSAQLATELFKSMTGTHLVHVPYKGITSATTDLLSGQVQVMFNAAASLLPHTRAGRMRALGVGALKRIPAIPDVPTLSESGVPGYQSGSWYGFVAPAGTPHAIIERLSRETAAAVKSPDISEKLAAEANIVVGSTPQEFAAHIKDELARISKVIQAAGITMK